MKKVISILVVLALVAGFAFAADSNTTEADAAGTAVINVNATIGAMYPVYQLAVNAGAGNAGTSVTTQGTSTNTTMVNAQIEKLSTLNETATVVFDINQIADSKCNSSYTLTVTAEPLYLIKNTSQGIDLTYAEARAYTGDDAANRRFALSGSVAHASTYTDTTRISVTSDNTKLTAVYTGLLVDWEEASPVNLGTATVKWAANTNAYTGNYQSQVSLTVAAI